MVLGQRCEKIITFIITQSDDVEFVVNCNCFMNKLAGMHLSNYDPCSKSNIQGGFILHNEMEIATIWRSWYVAN